MKRLIITLGLVAFGCDTNETSISILHVLAPEDPAAGEGCAFDPSGAAKAGPVVLDTAASLSIVLPMVVSNNLSARETNFGFGGVDSNVATRAEVTPLRFAARFECDTSAYSGSAASGLLIPRIDPGASFCIDDRADAAATQANSDILPAAGAAIPAAGTGIVVVNAIPHELGYAIDELFTIAALADDCCTGSTGCAGSTSVDACTKLQKIFDEIDTLGGLIAVGQPGAANKTLQTYAAYAVYEGVHISNADPNYNMKSTPAFSMTLRGQLQGVTGYGDIVESNDFSVAMETCRNCGFDVMKGRVPRAEFSCLRK